MRFVWPDSARSDPRAIDREIAIRILHGLTEFGESGEGGLSLSLSVQQIDWMTGERPVLFCFLAHAAFKATMMRPCCPDKPHAWQRATAGQGEGPGEWVAADLRY